MGNLAGSVLAPMSCEVPALLLLSGKPDALPAAGVHTHIHTLLPLIYFFPM